MARIANPLTTVTRQLKVIQARYKKLGMLIDKLTDEVSGAMGKDKSDERNAVIEEKKGAKGMMKLSMNSNNTTKRKKLLCKQKR